MHITLNRITLSNFDSNGSLLQLCEEFILFVCLLVVVVSVVVFFFFHG